MRLFSNFATGWAAFGLRIALVPLFVVEALGRGAGFAGLALATFAAGNISAVIPSGYLSDRVGRIHDGGDPSRSDAGLPELDGGGRQSSDRLERGQRGKGEHRQRHPRQRAGPGGGDA